MSEAVIFRADASAEIGTGHVMRCLALAQTLQDASGRPIFLMAPGAPSLEERLVSERMEILPILSWPGSGDDADETARLAQKVGASWVVADGYHFDAAYQRFVKDAGLSLLFIDDNRHADYYYADIVLNQNLHASESLYRKRERYTRLLLGTDFVLLRREFLKWRDWRREIPDVARKVLVTLGGSDPNNVTLSVIQALQQVKVDGLEAVVVVGRGNRRYEELQFAVRNSLPNIRLVRNVTNMPELMAWADVAVAAGGITAWELAFMGLPSLVIVLADNQERVAEQLKTTAMAVNLRSSKNLSPSEICEPLNLVMVTAQRREEMARRGKMLVDGEGSNRVLMNMGSKFSTLRHVREEDCKLLWRWANDPEVRAVSFSSAAIPWEEHVKWFRSKLNNSGCVFFIGTNGDEIPIGQIRYDLEGEKAVVSLSVDRKVRGKGYGSTLISLSARELFDTTSVTTIHAYVKHANEASVHAFEKAGYRRVATTTIGGEDAVHLVLCRSIKNAG
jgi:UDP-2,4-diacetamido-2,4,6-trideoxy-beta-L-altropyranose hydrolase